MRVQPLCPSKPLTTTTMRVAGLTVVACSAANMPAPPAPTIKMSQSSSSSGSNSRLGWHQVWVAYESVDAPVSDYQTDDHEHHGHGLAIGRRDATKVENDIS